tara:strand:+ start:132 stop:317 length:186 start_codon:yes stop_codon:yes gene_type:complete
MKQLDLENFECNVGLIIREKDNHDNYALLRFEDLEKIIEYYQLFKKEFDSTLNDKKMEKSK